MKTYPVLSISFSFLWLILSGIAPAKAESWIVEEGRANAEIVVAEKSTRSVRIAAGELQTYLKKITGAELSIVTSPTGTMPIKIFVGESAAAREKGVDAKGLSRDSFRIVSGSDWLALIGEDRDFTPVEPWSRNHNQWKNEKQAEWEKLAGHHWNNPVGSSIYKWYNKNLDFWAYDHRGSLNAVYAFLRDLGVRWYMPGELGEILPERTSIALSGIDKTVEPEFKVRGISRPLPGSPDNDDAMWYLRIGANKQYGILHHGQRHVLEHPLQRSSHPEYYAMLGNGKRDNEGRTPNACLSSEGFINEMVAFSRTMFDHYDIPIISVMPHDGFIHCQCDRCRDQFSPERGAEGQSSDYVWKFVVRVANELAKTHPGKKVFNGAYSTYRLPPQTIDKLPDNVLIQITNGRPIREMDDETHQSRAELRRQWLEKTSHPLSVTLNYTPLTNRGEYRPQYWPHVIARGLKDCADEVWREDVWLSSDKGGLHHPGMSHLNPFVISRFWWDATQDIDQLLAEYYQLFYGPAAHTMKAFIEYSEIHYGQLGTDGEITKEAIRLFDEAKAAAPPQSVYGKRIKLVDEYLETLRSRATQIRPNRPEGLPSFRLIDMEKEKWSDARETLQLDGKIDEAFWTAYSLQGNLRDLQSGEKPKYPTKFRARWWNDNLYLAIHCEGEPGTRPVIGTDRNNDPAIWHGEHLELLIETDQHAYYQIVINPAGALVDLDRGVKKEKWHDWASQAEVATHIGDGFWSVEMRLPTTASDEDPLHNIVGHRPFRSKKEALASGKGTSLPWYFNLYRKRAGTEDTETTAFSPLGPEATSFHDTLKFGELYVQ
ncbi:MAG: DUF4838 domain-containing protein [Verrucomicrobiales bacterium]|nr:DUF4838 domain-containing protein [Verrucomicrobiales bacterium]